MMIPKFRAWHKAYKQMLPVLTLHFDQQILWADCSDTHATMWDFKDIELMQWTGLNDINGKCIYDGDILKMYTGNKFISGKVSYCCMDGAYVLTFLDDNFTKQLHECAPCASTIIGNIYENPELVEHS